MVIFNWICKVKKLTQNSVYTLIVTQFFFYFYLKTTWSCRWKVIFSRDVCEPYRNWRPSNFARNKYDFTIQSLLLVRGCTCSKGLRNSHNLYNFAFTNKVVYFPHSWTQNQLPNAKSLQKQSSHVPADQQVTG